MINFLYQIDFINLIKIYCNAKIIKVLPTKILDSGKRGLRFHNELRVFIALKPTNCCIIISFFYQFSFRLTDQANQNVFVFKFQWCTAVWYVCISTLFSTWWLWVDNLLTDRSDSFWVISIERLISWTALPEEALPNWSVVHLVVNWYLYLLISRIMRMILINFGLEANTIWIISKLLTHLSN